jgi:hypothetical protein
MAYGPTDWPPPMMTLSLASSQIFTKRPALLQEKKNSLLYAFATEAEAWNFALELGTEEQAGDGRLPMPTNVQNQLDARNIGKSLASRAYAGLQPA